MAETASDNDNNRGITICTLNGEETRQPKGFVFCSFGLQVFTPEPFDSYKPVELTFRIQGNNGDSEHVSCTGIAVDTKKDAETDLYTTAIRLLNAPPAVRERLCCQGVDAGHICNYCNGRHGDEPPQTDLDRLLTPLR